MQTLEELLKLWKESAMTQLEAETLIDLLIAEKKKLTELRQYKHKAKYALNIIYMSGVIERQDLVLIKDLI